MGCGWISRVFIIGFGIDITVFFWFGSWLICGFPDFF
jgi:hypothetical protein